MSWRRIWAIARKELVHITRDLRSLIMAVAVPFLMLLLFGYALSLDVDEIPALVFDLDRTPQSRELVEEFTASRYFRIPFVAERQQQIEAEIDRGRIFLGIVIPEDYSEQLLTGGTAQIQLLIDGSDSNTASIAVSYADGVVQRVRERWLEESFRRKVGAEFRSAVEPRLRVWYNNELKSKNYIVPGLIAVILMIISALLTSLTIAREWEMGSMEQILSTPLRPQELVLGKMAAFFVVGVTDAAVAIGAGVLIFEVPFRGSWLLLFATTFLFLFGALCWGILLSAIARSQTLAFQMGIISSFLPAFLLSGFVFGIENMPRVVQVITYIVSARYFVTILKGIFLKGVGIEILFGEIVFLLLYSTLVFVAATRKVGSRLA
ncbi:MAG: ABC transporter permease [Acidobacteriota bacterium]